MAEIIAGDAVDLTVQIANLSDVVPESAHEILNQLIKLAREIVVAEGHGDLLNESNENDDLHFMAVMGVDNGSIF